MTPQQITEAQRLAEHLDSDAASREIVYAMALPGLRNAATLLRTLATQAQQPIPAEDVEFLAHRIAWRYKMSTDRRHSDTYTFNRATLLQFAEALRRAALEGLKA